jgi:ankyrin repeat protein
MANQKSPSSQNCRKGSNLFGNDDEYFLRCCLDYNWPLVDKCCDDLVRILTTPGTSSSPETTKASSSRIHLLREKATRQLLAKDRWGNTPLHAACYHKPSVQTVAAILKVASLLPSGPYQLHFVKNDRHTTPLTIACTNGASNQVIEELLRPSSPGMIRGGACVNEGNNDGQSTFLGLLQRYEMNRLFPALKPTYVPLEKVTSIEGVPDISSIFTPSTSLESMSSTGNDKSRNTMLAAALTDEEWDRLTLSSTMFQTFWQILDTLMQAAWWSNHESVENTADLRGSFHSIVHSAAYLAEIFPAKLTDLVLRTNPHVFISTDDTDSNAILPLHLAISTNQVQRINRIHPRLVYQRKYFIDRLLEMDPSAALRPMPKMNYNNNNNNSHHRSALCQAIASGLTWHIPSLPENVLLQEFKNEQVVGPSNMERGPLQSLWHCAPGALYEIDPVTGIYPCMLAASVATSNDDDGSFSVDTIYNLLRLYPQVLAGSS